MVLVVAVSALSERRRPAHRGKIIHTWTGGDRRQLSVGLSHAEWLALDEHAKMCGIARGAMARLIIQAWIKAFETALTKK
jgi:hypothetical protein